MVEGLRIVDAARAWLGVRWRHQGRNSHSGVDCIGLCICVARECGYRVPDATGYARRQDGGQLIAVLSSHLSVVPTDQGRQGDVALFRDEGFPVHVGIMALKRGLRTVIHAHARRRQVLEEPLETVGQPLGMFRLKERI